MPCSPLSCLLPCQQAHDQNSQPKCSKNPIDLRIAALVLGLLIASVGLTLSLAGTISVWQGALATKYIWLLDSFSIAMMAGGAASILVGLATLSIRKSSAEQPLTAERLSQKLDKWVEQAPEEQKKDHITAKKCIMDCFNERKDELTIQNSALSNIPAAIGRFTWLKKLVMIDCGLMGEIPDFGQLKALEHLDLSENELTGKIPPHTGQSDKLEWLDLSNNQLKGEIPTEIGQSKALKHLYLEHNELEGEIPPNIGQSPKLKYLDLSHNQLKGPIPTEIGQSKVLRTLYLQYNRLEGEIPPNIGQSPKLKYLDLSNNQLKGPIPTEIGQSPNLTNLYLSRNMLEGLIPARVQELVSEQKAELEHNHLEYDETSISPE